jgi:hypothetical protein
MKRETLGRELVFYDPLNVLSYAMARLKSDNLGPGAAYRNNDYRRVRQKIWQGHDTTSWHHTTYHPTKSLAKCWRRHTEIRRAKKRGDHETLKWLEAEQDASLAATVGKIQAIFAAAEADT